MLVLHIPETEAWNEVTNEFLRTKACTLQLEHSLISISKWESKWHKPFLSNDQKTETEIRDYIRCMTLTQNVDPLIYQVIPNRLIKQVVDYMDDPMTATTFGKESPHKHSRQIVTSELIYYWMIALQIPPEYQKWHLNRLLTLIHVCDVKNTPQKKRTPKELAKRNTALNEARRKAMNSSG